MVVGYLIRLVALPKHAANRLGLVVLGLWLLPRRPEGAATCQPRAERSAALGKSEQGVFALKGHNKDRHITCPHL